MAPRRRGPAAPPGGGGGPKIAEQLAGDTAAVQLLRLAREFRVTEAEILGLPHPPELHTHYDADGNITGQTVVERASAWTDEQRNRMLGLQEYESHCCTTCGTHEDLDPEENVYVPDAKRCRICGGLAVHQRVTAVDDDAEAKRLKDQPREPRDKDGRKLILRPATPAELEEREERRQRPRGGQTSDSTTSDARTRERRPRKGLARG